MYNDVIRVGDAEKLMDCSSVQVSLLNLVLIKFPYFSYELCILFV